MRLFHKLSSIDGEDALITAASAVVEKVIKIPEPRSLCEIKADEDDYQWLCNWIGQVTPYQLRRWLEGINSRKIALKSGNLNLSYIEAIGCLLLLLASESARRRASEGQVWPAIRHRFAERPSSVLFVQGQPQRVFKNAIEAVARKLHLRHVFGIEGTQNYYLTVYLQFGFTQKGMERLAHWLAGQPSTQAIMYLLGDQGQSLVSRSFVKLWDVLRNFRRNNITEAQARRTLADNPWILPDWTDELLTQARRHHELGTAEAGQAGSGEQDPPQFLDNPRLCWNWPAEPKFTTSVVNLADFDLTAERYQVKSGTAVLTTLVATEDETYSSYPEKFVLPSEFPKPVVSILDSHGIVQASQLLELWDRNEDVEIFDLQTGKRLDAYDKQRTRDKEYGLLTSIDLEIEPSNLPFHTIGIGDNTKKLYLLSSSIEHPVRVILFGEEIWNSHIDGGALPKQPRPAWAETITTTLIPARVQLGHDERIHIRISGLGRDTELLYVRVGSKALDFRPEDKGIFLTEEFNIISDIVAQTSLAFPEIKTKLGIRHGAERTAVEHANVLNVSGILRASDDGWQVVRHEEKLLVNDAKRIPFKLYFPGMGQEVDRFALLEGPVFLKKFWRRPRPLGQLGGYGAPLELRSPYNFTDSKIVLATEVHDPGIFESVLIGDNAKIRLYFGHPIEPGSRHKIVLWDIGKPLVVLETVEHIKQQDSEWTFTIPDLSFSEGFIALAYNGVKVGSWWPAKPDWSSVSGGDATMETAALLKWMHSPIVSPAWLDNVRSFAQRYPAQTLAAWLLDEGLPSSLCHSTVDEEQWRAAIRQVFSGWVPDEISAWEIITVLGKSSPDDPISEALQVLLHQDPLLMGKVARVWIESSHLPCLGDAKDKQDLISRMRFLVAELEHQDEQGEQTFLLTEGQEVRLAQDPKLMRDLTNAWLKLPNAPGSAGKSIKQREEELLIQASTSMSVDDHFLKDLVLRVIGPMDYYDLEDKDKFNTETALTTAPFREYLGLRVLSHLLLEIE